MTNIILSTVDGVQRKIISYEQCLDFAISLNANVKDPKYLMGIINALQYNLVMRSILNIKKPGIVYSLQ